MVPQINFLLHFDILLKDTGHDFEKFKNLEKTT
jgi:hypothetical protein